MKVIEGNFGVSKEKPISAGEMFTALAEGVTSLEEDNVEVKAAVVVYVDGTSLQVLSNDTYPDSAYMLFNMAAQTIMLETLGVTE
jgi:hypothetical protein